MSKVIDSPHAVEEETLGETLRTLGVGGAEKVSALTDVQWCGGVGKTSGSEMITLTAKGGLYFPKCMVGGDLMDGGGAERIRVGHGLLKGERVMLIKADIGGYKYYSGKGRKAMILSQAVLKVLSDAGLKKGYYRPKKIKGGWMGGVWHSARGGGAKTNRNTD